MFGKDGSNRAKFGSFINLEIDLMSFGADGPSAFRHGTKLVQNLQGRQPKDVPIEQPTKFELACHQSQDRKSHGPQNSRFVLAAGGRSARMKAMKRREFIKLLGGRVCRRTGAAGGNAG
jgi:hypothetical protein